MLGRIRRWLAREVPGFDPRWHSVLQRDFEHWRMLSPAELVRMEELVTALAEVDALEAIYVDRGDRVEAM